MKFTRPLKSVVAASKTVAGTTKKGIATGYQKLSHQTYHVGITGLSRSGKSTLFASILALLEEYAQNKDENYLPLLSALPFKQVLSVSVKPLGGEKMYPIEQAIASLKKGDWPESTRDVFGFEIFIELQLRQEQKILKHLTEKETLSIALYDYPGEWLTDLPMLNMSFTQWSAHCLSQLSSRPQSQFATEFIQVMNTMNFDDTSPESAEGRRYIAIFQQYLHAAKEAGITILQPATMLIGARDFDWVKQGFCPLPGAVTTDPKHPWLLHYQENFEQYKKTFLQPFAKRYFTKMDKQIVLLDVLEGLYHGQNHLKQLRESLANLSKVFTYGESSWLSAKILGQHKISQIAFVASKVDCLPASQRKNLLALLQDISINACNVLKEHKITPSHFLLSSIKATINDVDGEPNVILFYNKEGETIKKTFNQSVPTRIQDFGENTSFIQSHFYPKRDFMQMIKQAEGVDRLLNFILSK